MESVGTRLVVLSKASKQTISNQSRWVWQSNSTERRFLNLHSPDQETTMPPLVIPTPNQQETLLPEEPNQDNDHTQDLPLPEPTDPAVAPDIPRVPKAIRDLSDYNNRGLKQDPSNILPTRLRSGRI